MTSLKLTLCIFLILCSFSMLAQDQMERLYRSNRQNTALDVVQTSDEGYLILSAGREPDSTDYDFYNLLKLDNKGNLSWSRDYQFEEKVNPTGTLTLLEADSFLVYGSLANPPKHRFLMKGDPSGNIVMTKGYERGNVNNNVFIFETALDTSYRDGYVIGGVDVNPSNNTALSWMGELDGNADFIWSKNYTNPTHEGLTFVNLQTTRDSGLIVCGSVSETLPLAPPDLFLIKTDSLGTIEWSRKYGDDIPVESGSAVAQTPDGGYLLGGTKNTSMGVLVKTDTIGVVEWAADVDFELIGNTVLIHQIIIASDGNAIIAGSLVGRSAQDYVAHF